MYSSQRYLLLASGGFAFEHKTLYLLDIRNKAKEVKRFGVFLKP